MTQLLERIDTGDLLQHIPSSLRISLEMLDRAGADWNAVGGLLAAAPTTGVAVTGTGQWTTDLWQAVKWEFRSFLCTDSEPYAELRKDWDTLAQRSSARALVSLSAIIGAKIGVASGVLVPMVIWLFVVARRTDRDALALAFSSAPADGSVLPRSHSA